MGCEGCPHKLYRTLTGRCPHVIFDLDEDDDLYGECPIGGKRYLHFVDVEEDNEGYMFDIDEAYASFIQIINATPDPGIVF